MTGQAPRPWPCVSVCAYHPRPAAVGDDLQQQLFRDEVEARQGALLRLEELDQSGLAELEAGRDCAEGLWQPGGRAGGDYLATFSRR